MKSSTYQKIEIRPTTGAFGTEIFGVDLSEPLSDEVFNEINQALLDYHVIFFRDQDITPRQHVDFGRRFGELHIHPFIPAHEDQPEIIVLGGKTPGAGPLRPKFKCLAHGPDVFPGTTDGFDFAWPGNT